MTGMLDARAQLRALAADPVGLPPGPWRRMQPSGSARRAAVLVLFGHLDAVPARATAPVAADLDVLLQRRSAEMSHHPGQISFPGGGMDPGESPIQAALREAVEETGLDPTGVEVLGELGPLPLPVSDNLVTPVLAWWASPSQVAAVDHLETVEVFRVPVADLLHPANRAVALRGPYRTPAFEVGDVLVWGFTAMVLSGVFDALGWTQPWDARRVVVPTA